MTMNKLLERALAGDTRSIGRLISLVEADSPASKEIMKTVYPKTGGAQVIGITGSPGAGKSTFVNRLIAQFRAEGKQVGVIAIDPSSPFTGGAILGDRLRMQDHAIEEGVFIRSMGSRGNLGGVSRGTHEGALILDACGFDVVIIETVGVGQSEVDIVKIADTVCLILTPGMGDDVQIMKAGIMEIADVFVVNKADKEGADKMCIRDRHRAVQQRRGARARVHQGSLFHPDAAHRPLLAAHQRRRGGARPYDTRCRHHPFDDKL